MNNNPEDKNVGMQRPCPILVTTLTTGDEKNTMNTTTMSNSGNGGGQ